MMAMKRMSMGVASHMSADEARTLNHDVAKYKEESEKVWAVTPRDAVRRKR
jgi:hypothetical protein